MKQFTSFLNHSAETLQHIVQRALAIKNGSVPKSIAGKTLGMLFFNPSLRTRVSFETAMKRFGGHVVALSAGGDVWSLETREGAVMNQNKTEHIKDAARVLSRYCDALAVRTFAALKDIQEDLSEETLATFSKYATVPVISMESSMEHPCQALADMLTIKERFKDRNVSFTLTWAPHIKPLPMAVPHSALLAAANLGCDITLAHPKGFDLAPGYIEQVTVRAKACGGSFAYTDNQLDACTKADVVYAKNWAPFPLYNDAQKLSDELLSNSSWKMTQSALKRDALFMHCLPVRRNLEVADEVLDGPNSGVYDQAENRMWAQAAVLEKIFSE